MAPKSTKKKSSKPSKPRHCRRAYLAANALFTLDSLELLPNQFSSPPLPTSDLEPSPTPQAPRLTSTTNHPDEGRPTTPRGNEPPMSLIDPRLLEPTVYGPQTPPATPTSTQVLPQTLAQPEDSMNSDDSDNSDSDDNNSKQGSHAGRIRITKDKPKYGFVMGAKRGGYPFEVLRTKELQPPILESTKSCAWFIRCMSDILVRCERVANQTGCWIFLAAQHTTARVLKFNALTVSALLT
ncbi:hypothetical protein BD779DRAFT_1679840 [Infundibulicybe gibba]|nr:hypothetical protein BD779DRAFT_1679840 [Infundibulicybe gibba]